MSRVDRERTTHKIEVQGKCVGRLEANSHRLSVESDCATPSGACEMSSLIDIEKSLH